MLRYNSYTNAERNTQSDSNGYANTDTMHGKMWTDSASAPNASSEAEADATNFSDGNGKRHKLVMHYLRDAQEIRWQSLISGLLRVAA